MYWVGILACVVGEFFLVWIWWTNLGFSCYVIACLMTMMVVGIDIGMHNTLLGLLEHFHLQQGHNSHACGGNLG
jgi:hypothetical protein